MGKEDHMIPSLQLWSELFNKVEMGRYTFTSNGGLQYK